MTDRLEEIRARREAATPGGELFARLTQECDNCYTPQAQLLRACTYHEGWLDGHGERDPDIDYLLAEVERLTVEGKIASERRFDEHIKFMQGVAMALPGATGNEPLPNESNLIEQVRCVSAEIERLRAALERFIPLGLSGPDYTPDTETWKIGGDAWTEAFDLAIEGAIEGATAALTEGGES